MITDTLEFGESPLTDILLVALGGTIACKKTQKGLVPKVPPRELLQYAYRHRPGRIGKFLTWFLGAIFNIPSGRFHVVTPFEEGIDSSLMFFEDWIRVARIVYDLQMEYNLPALLTTGTDSLADLGDICHLTFPYGMPGTFITGSQIEINQDRTDAIFNLRSAIHMAATAAAIQKEANDLFSEVYVVEGNRVNYPHNLIKTLSETSGERMDQFTFGDGFASHLTGDPVRYHPQIRNALVNLRSSVFRIRNVLDVIGQTYLGFYDPRRIPRTDSCLRETTHKTEFDGKFNPALRRN